MEGRVFACTWERSGARYRVWVRNRPALRAEGDVFDAADEALADVICGATGDGESVREYDPPRPVEDQSGLLFRLAAISGERRGFIENPAELFNEDYCPQCKRPRGNRTAAALRLARIEPGQGGGFAKMEPPSLVGPLMSFFPETFVARLRPDEQSQFQWRPVHAPKRIKTRFVELVSAKVHIPGVSLSGAAATLWDRPSIVQKEAHAVAMRYMREDPATHLLVSDVLATTLLRERFGFAGAFTNLFRRRRRGVPQSVLYSRALERTCEATRVARARLHGYRSRCAKLG